MPTDASDLGLGAVLFQENDESRLGLRPVAFFSRALSPAQRNYMVVQKECVAMFFALQKFDIFVEGTSFMVQTDHQRLLWLSHLQKRTGR